MIKKINALLSVFASIGVGLILCDSMTWGYAHEMTQALEGFASLRFRETIAALALTVILCAPIGAFARGNAAWFGALAAITYEIALFWSWLALPEPRPHYSFGYLFGAVAQVALLALVSVFWWQAVFKRFVRPMPSG